MNAIDAGMTARPTAFRAPATVRRICRSLREALGGPYEGETSVLGGDDVRDDALLGPRNVSESEVSVDGSIASENRMTTCVSVGTWVDPSAGIAAATSGDAAQLALLAAPDRLAVARGSKGPRRARDGHRRGGTPVSSTCHRHQRGGMPWVIDRAARDRVHRLCL